MAKHTLVAVDLAKSRPAPPCSSVCRAAAFHEPPPAQTLGSPLAATSDQNAEFRKTSPEPADRTLGQALLPPSRPRRERESPKGQPDRSS